MREVTAILEVISSISSSLTLDEILAQFTEKTTQIVGADGCAISVWDHQQDTLTVLADYVAPHIVVPADEVSNLGAAYPLDHFPASARVLQEQTPLIIYTDDPAADQAERELLQSFQWAGVLMVPMLYKGQAVGLLELYSDNNARCRFRADEVVLGQALANQVAIAIENVRLYQETEEGRLHAEAMQVISRVLASELDYQRITDQVANFAYRLINAAFVYVAVPTPKGFRQVATAGHEKKASGDTLSAPSESWPDQMLLDRVTRGPVLVPDIQADQTYPALRRQAEGQGWRAILAVPVLYHDQLLGVLVACSRQPYFFKPNDVAILMSLASQAAVAIQNARLFEELETQRQTLHQLSLRLVNAQEEERRRISRELHDELSQALTALKINLEVAQRVLPSDASARLQHALHEATGLAIQTLETARNLSLELHPAILDDLGLISALHWEVDRYEQRTGQEVHFKAEPLKISLEPEVELTVYRIITEALTNVARHAQARHVSIFLQVQEQWLQAQVEDDGLGFDVGSRLAAPAGRQSLGLVSMRERAGLLGGELNVSSRPGQGTRVSLRLPLASRRLTFWSRLNGENENIFSG